MASEAAAKAQETKEEDVGGREGKEAAMVAAVTEVVWVAVLEEERVGADWGGICTATTCPILAAQEAKVGTVAVASVEVMAVAGLLAGALVMVEVKVRGSRYESTCSRLMGLDRDARMRW